jgi:hypothetical protein
LSLFLNNLLRLDFCCLLLPFSKQLSPLNLVEFFLLLFSGCDSFLSTILAVAMLHLYLLQPANLLQPVFLQG